MKLGNLPALVDHEAPVLGMGQVEISTLYATLHRPGVVSARGWEIGESVSVCIGDQRGQPHRKLLVEVTCGDDGQFVVAVHASCRGQLAQDSLGVGEIVLVDLQSLPLGSRTILVIDEASTLSDRDLDTLMDMAATTGASIRLVGDPAQHGAIAAGGMFRVLCEPHTRHTPELTTTHRLQNPHDRAAAQALREGRIDEAFDQLAAAGHLHVVDDDLAMYRQVLGRCWDAHREGLDHPMVDRRNSTRRQLNRLAHLLRRVNGELEGEEITASADRSLTVGDRITARAPNRDLHVDGDRRA